jgi:transposase-like protein
MKNKHNIHQNILRDIHTVFSESATVFQKAVCKECGYSRQNYYRTKTNSLYKSGQSKINLAEKRSIIAQAEAVIMNLNTCIDRYRHSDL